MNGSFCVFMNDLMVTKGFTDSRYFTHSSDNNIYFNLYFLYGKHPNGRVFSYEIEGNAIALGEIRMGDINKWIKELIEPNMLKYGIKNKNIFLRFKDDDFGEQLYY